MTTARALIADDQPDVLEALRLLLKNEGFQTEAAQSPAAVLDKLQSNSFDLILMDLNYTRDTTSGQEGLDLLARIQAIDRTLPVVAMTAGAHVDVALQFEEDPYSAARGYAPWQTVIKDVRGTNELSRQDAEIAKSSLRA